MGIRPIKLKGIVLFILLTVGIGALGNLLSGNVSEVYAGLNKPPLAPSGIVFPIVWNVLYVLLGIGAYILSAEKSPEVSSVLRLYWFQILLNPVWSLIFWRFNMYTLAAFLLGVLIILAIILIVRAASINKVSALLFIPYLLWLCFALYLNIGIAILN